MMMSKLNGRLREVIGRRLYESEHEIHSYLKNGWEDLREESREGYRSRADNVVDKIRAIPGLDEDDQNSIAWEIDLGPA
jgi:hypothetical protein